MNSTMNRAQMTQAQRLAEDLLASKEWRDDQNEAAGRTLTVKEMYEVAARQASHLVETAQEG